MDGVWGCPFSVWFLFRCCFVVGSKLISMKILWVSFLGWKISLMSGAIRGLVLNAGRCCFVVFVVGSYFGNVAFVRIRTQGAMLVPFLFYLWKGREMKQKGVVCCLCRREICYSLGRLWTWSFLVGDVVYGVLVVGMMVGSSGRIFSVEACVSLIFRESDVTNFGDLLAELFDDDPIRFETSCFRCVMLFGFWLCDFLSWRCVNFNV